MFQAFPSKPENWKRVRMAFLIYRGLNIIFHNSHSSLTKVVLGRTQTLAILPNK